MEQRTRMYLLTAVLAIVVMVGVSVAALVASWQIDANGEIKTIGVEAYIDLECTTLCESINWGALDPGDETNVTLYIKNVEVVPFTLTMNASNWLPITASDYLTMTWDYDDSILTADQVLPVTFTLTVNAAIEGIAQFSHDIFIIATETAV